jgi:hypothetical protein
MRKSCLSSTNKFPYNKPQIQEKVALGAGKLNKQKTLQYPEGFFSILL